MFKPIIKQQFFLFLLVSNLFLSCSKDDNVNTEPVIEDQSFSIEEHSLFDTVVGLIQASDGDGQNLTFNVLEGNDQEIFEITSSGEILVKKPVALNYEQVTTFELVVEVTDNFDPPGSDQAIVTIDVINILIPTDGMIGYYALNGDANDETNNQNHGQLDGTEPVEDRFGIANSALKFDGEFDFVEIPHNNIYNFGPDDNFSFSLWLKVASVQEIESSGENSILAKTNRQNPFNPGLDHPFQLLLNNARSTVDPVNSVSASRRQHDDCQTMIGQSYVTSESGIADEWYHVAFVKEQEVLSIFVNGARESAVQDETESHCETSNSGSIFLGRTTFGGGGPFTGMIDDLKFYNRALTDAEVSELYTEVEE